MKRLALLLAACLAQMLAGCSRDAFAQYPSLRPYDQFHLDLKTSGHATPLGVITCAGGASRNNHTTAVPFLDTGNALAGRTLLVYANAVAGRVLDGATNAFAVVATPGDPAAGVPLVAGERVIYTMPELTPQGSLGVGGGWLAYIGAGSAQLEVWELN